MTKFARIIALPVLSAGVIGGAALGLAGAANAATTVTSPQGPGYSYSHVVKAQTGPAVTPGHQGHHGPDRAAALLNR
jgi:hypothetical protein